MTTNSKTVLYNRDFLYAISMLFNAPQVLKLEDPKQKRYLEKVLTKTNIDRRKKFTINSTYDWFYGILKEQYRCEYVYKNEIAKQLLLAIHSLREARLFTEVEIHKSKADVLIVNGTSTVYEIKTELDSFDRLNRQLESYGLVFDKVYVVTHAEKVPTLLQLVDTGVGIMVLDKRGKIRTIREAASNKDNLSPYYMFNVLNKSEYLAVINDHFGSIPQVSQVQLFSECKKLFCQLEPAVAHDYMVRELRQRAMPSYREELAKSAPDSLKLVATTGKLTKKECGVINIGLKVKL